MPCASVEEIIFRLCRSSHEIHKFRYINDLLDVVKTLVASCLNAMRSRFSEPCGFWPLQALQADPLRDGHRQVRKIRNPAPAVTSAYCMTSFAARGVHTFASLPDDGRLCAACVKLGPEFRGAHGPISNLQDAQQTRAVSGRSRMRILPWVKACRTSPTQSDF